MSDLHLDSLEIKNFRCFEHLVIEKLGRVNLIVGKNSVGKTCLLEALLIYATGGNFSVIQKLLTDRGELHLPFPEGNSIILSTQPASLLLMHQMAKALRHIFFERKLTANKTEACIRDNGNKGIAFKLIADNEQIRALGRDSNELPSFDVEPPSFLDQLIQKELFFHWYQAKPGSHDESYQVNIALFQESELAKIVSQKLQDAHTIFIPQKGLSNEEMKALWNRVSLRDSEKQVIDAMSKVAESVERMNFIGDTDSNDLEKYPMVKIKQAPEPVPLGQLGEGVSRAMGISLALANTSDGFLLIDEFETGLHHSTQTDMWRMIFETAKRLNIQVFATTHSWDCVEAFQEASSENEDARAMLIRLQRKRDGTRIVATPYDKESVEIVTRQGIEVR